MINRFAAQGLMLPKSTAELARSFREYSVCTAPDGDGVVACAGLRVYSPDLAEIVGSEDLYVAWSHESGAGAIPEVEAVLVEAQPLNPLAEFVAALAAGFSGMWRALLGRPRHSAMHSAPPADPARRATA